MDGVLASTAVVNADGAVEEAYNEELQSRLMRLASVLVDPCIADQST